jgi:hypothetical protein
MRSVFLPSDTAFVQYLGRIARGAGERSVRYRKLKGPADAAAVLAQCGARLFGHIQADCQVLVPAPAKCRGRHSASGRAVGR